MKTLLLFILISCVNFGCFCEENYDFQETHFYVDYSWKRCKDDWGIHEWYKSKATRHSKMYLGGRRLEIHFYSDPPGADLFEKAEMFKRKSIHHIYDQLNKYNELFLIQGGVDSNDITFSFYFQGTHCLLNVFNDEDSDGTYFILLRTGPVYQEDIDLRELEIAKNKVGYLSI